jgi:hypothetical protein
MVACKALISNEPCVEPPIIGWQRMATSQEIADFILSGDLPQGTTHATVPIYACDLHKITDELLGALHLSTCGAPPTCDCGVEPPEQWEP